MELSSPRVPVLRCQRRRNLDGPGDEFTPGLGTGSRGLSGNVRDPPVLSSVLRANRRNAALECSREGSRSWSIEKTVEGRRLVACAEQRVPLFLGHATVEQNSSDR